jgi:hypothetical protein
MMSSLKDRIIDLIKAAPGLTDREITDRLLGRVEGQQVVNQAARSLERSGQLIRRSNTDGKIGNYPNNVPRPETPVVKATETAVTDGPSEDDVKRGVDAWLRAAGWHVDIKWGHDRGIDIDATRDGRRWIIEAKGCGSRDQMRVNYFLSMLGELLQRMSDANARYSIALPDMPQFRRLWDRLPLLAKSRTEISVLFVDAGGRVEEVRDAGQAHT